MIPRRLLLLPILLLLLSTSCASTATNSAAITTLNKANQALAEKKWDQAIAYFTELKTTLPFNSFDFSLIHSGLGMAWCFKGNEKKAEENLILAVKYAPPDYAEPYFFMGLIYFGKAKAEIDLGRKKYYLTEAMNNFILFEQKYPGSPPCPEFLPQLSQKGLKEADALLDEVNSQIEQRQAEKKAAAEKAR